VGGRYGTYLLSALGGPPRFLTPGAAGFYADGDSLLIGSSNSQDSVYWVGIAGLDGVPHDSVAVHGHGQFLAGVSAIPGTHWILTLIVQAPHGLWQVLDRSGKVADQVVNQCTCGGLGSVDAVWLDRQGDAAGESIVRIPINRATGHLSTQQDTMVTGLFTGVSVTADGEKMVMDMGTIEYSLWAASFADLAAGKLPADERVAHASNYISARLSPDGSRIIVMRVVPTTGEHTAARFSVRAFDGGAETPLTAPGTPLHVDWIDSVTVRSVSQTDAGLHFGLIDVRTGAQHDGYDIPDSTVRDAMPLNGGWAWIPSSRDRVIVERGGKQRSVAAPAWFLGIDHLIPDASGTHAFVIGFNRSTTDTLGVADLDLTDGSSKQWGAVFAEDGFVQPLAGGELLFGVHRTEETLDLYRLSGPGRMQLIATPAHPLLGVSVSADLKRAVAFQRDYNADAWMYDVVKR
jgi:hypothetical protein